MDEFKQIVEFAAIVGAIVAVVVQKIKENVTLKNAQWCTLISLALNMTLGVLIAHRFGGYTWEQAAWVGGIGYYGAVICIANLGSSGNLTIRNATSEAAALSGGASISITYVI